jgi:peptidoglycan/LPS O-acetylase OafA/YrhL
MKSNNFDLARLILATMVVFFHSFALSQNPSLRILDHVDQQLAVEGFFVISGFLIFASCERSKSLSDYFLKRAKRIMPGYLFATLLCVTIAIAFTHSLHLGRFLLANLSFMSFLQPGVPGLFEQNPHTTALNGALWTIKIEVMFYLIVPVLLWLCRSLGRVPVLVGLGCLSVIYRYAFASHPTLAQQLPGQLSFFCAGALAYFYLPTFRRWGFRLVVPALCLCALYIYTGQFFLRPLSIPILVLTFSLLLPEMRGPTRWGDFSYGTYVLHYPIVQTLVALGLFQSSPWLAFALTLALVAAFAVFSWHFVERRWLKPRVQQQTSIKDQRPEKGQQPELARS